MEMKSKLSNNSFKQKPINSQNKNYFGFDIDNSVSSNKTGAEKIKELYSSRPQKQSVSPNIQQRQNRLPSRKLEPFIEKSLTPGAQMNILYKENSISTCSKENTTFESILKAANNNKESSSITLYKNTLPKNTFIQNRNSSNDRNL